MFDTSGTIGADLDGVGSASEETVGLVVTEFGELFGDEVGMIKTASANMLADGRKRDNDGWVGEIG